MRMCVEDNSKIIIPTLSLLSLLIWSTATHYSLKLKVLIMALCTDSVQSSKQIYQTKAGFHVLSTNQ